MTAPTVSLTTLSRDELESLRADQQDAYDLLQARGLALDLTRGKPSPAQLDLSNGLLDLPGDGHTTDASGVDVRNYGGVQGLKELRSIFSELLNVPVDQLVAGDNASLAMMHDVLVYSLLKGNHDSDGPWVAGGPVKFLCPSPGYDRHFALCAQFGIEMIPVSLNDDGPDVDEVAALVAADPQIKGIWLVPTYANPTGAVVSDDVARALASMPAAAADFRIFWDNAYAVHHLTEVETPTADILRFADEAGHPDRVYVFASTSKITFAGAGVCFFGGSDANVAWYLRHLAKRTIGPDKVNQLRHALFLRDAAGVRELMARHRDDHRAQVRAGHLDPPGSPRRAPGRDLDRAQGWLLRQPRRARRHCGPCGGARQGGRDRDDPCRVGVPVRQRPPRPQHPYRSHVPVRRRGGGRHRRTGHVRSAGGDGEAARGLSFSADRPAAAWSRARGRPR